MRMTLLLLALVIAGSVPAEAQKPLESFADVWMGVKTGDTVIVTDGSGQQTTAVFAKVSDSTLSLLVGGQLRDIPFTDVREVAKQGDSLWNGFLIGAGIGAALGAAAQASCTSRAYSIGSTPCLPPAAVAVLGLLSGGVGALIDHFIIARTVVFRVKSTALRLDPGFSLNRSGLSLSVAFSSR
jgi:hypothetical protein